MYDEDDIDAAVAAGALSPEAAASLRAFVAANRVLPEVDEEHVRLVSGFNDIFVCIAAGLILGAVMWLAGALSGALVAVVSWGLAEYFTRRRRMALPSIVFLLTFVGGIFAAVNAAIGAGWENGGIPLGMAGASAAAALGAYAHWRRFMVPITVAAGAVAVTGTAVFTLAGFFPRFGLEWGSLLLFLAGLGVFALAMRWDASDRQRLTRRSDVAFWLHLAAAPLIVHPAFAALGVLSGAGPGVPQAVAAVAVYAVLAVVALAVDRRALLVSALAYVLYAMAALLRAVGTPSASAALTALVIGAALLLLSALWHRTRVALVGRLPAVIRAALPAI